MNRIPILLSAIFLVTVFGNIIHIPMHKHKSAREHMIHSVTNEKDFRKLMQEFKPKPKPNRDNDTIALYKFLDATYYAPIRIGKPAQVLKMSIDTTWADSWVYSYFCPAADEACSAHTRYDSTKSATYLRNGTKYSVQDGNATLRGYLSTDSVNLAHVTVQEFTFMEVTETPPAYAYSPADGILGFALKSDGYLTPLFYRLYEQKLVKQPIFSFYINRDATTDHAGSIFLGGYDKKHFNESTLFYLGLENYGYWEFKMERIVLESVYESHTFCKDGCVAALDTSTPLTMGPYDEIYLLNQLLGARSVIYENRFEIPCDTIPKLPSLFFTLGNTTFKLNGKELAQRIKISDNVEKCLSIFVPTTSQPEPVPSNNWILGGKFMERVYVICDLVKSKIGFASVDHY